MARIAGVNIPVNKRLKIALTYIYGIGYHRALQICNLASVSEEKKVNQLNDAEIVKLREVIDKNYAVEGDLRREVSLNIENKKQLGSYEGLRHRRNLPVRGQRTHTNARTRKGKAKPIAGKKK